MTALWAVLCAAARHCTGAGLPAWNRFAGRLRGALLPVVRIVGAGCGHMHGWGGAVCSWSVDPGVDAAPVSRGHSGVKTPE